MTFQNSLPGRRSLIQTHHLAQEPYLRVCWSVSRSFHIPCRPICLPRAPLRTSSPHAPSFPPATPVLTSITLQYLCPWSPCQCLDHVPTVKTGLMHFLFHLPPWLSVAPHPSSPPVHQCPEGRHTAGTLHPKPDSSEARLASGTTQTQSLPSCPPWRLRSLPHVAHGEPPEVTMAQFRLCESSKRETGGCSRHFMGVWGCFY